MMKLKSVHILLIIALVVAILMLASSDTVVPYSKDTLFSHMYKYEGMNGMPPTPDENGEIKINESLTEHDNSDSRKEPKKVEGFALQPAPFGGSQMLDRFGNTPSGPQCFGNSSGYSKSLGPLCLSQEDARMLSTRGGNISGTDSTIGR